MKNFIEYLKEKLKNNLSIQQINITDNTHKHRKHKQFQVGMHHISLEIKSETLNNLTKIEAQRYIMKILKEELKKKIYMH